MCLPEPINRNFTKFQIENSQLARWSQFQSNLFKTIQGKVQKLTKHPRSRGCFVCLSLFHPCPHFTFVEGPPPPPSHPPCLASCYPEIKTLCRVSNIPSSASMSTTIFSLFGELIFYNTTIWQKNKIQISICGFCYLCVAMCSSLKMIISLE